MVPFGKTYYYSRAGCWFGKGNIGPMALTTAYNIGTFDGSLADAAKKMVQKQYSVSTKHKSGKYFINGQM